MRLDRARWRTTCVGRGAVPIPTWIAQVAGSTECGHSACEIGLCSGAASEISESVAAVESWTWQLADPPVASASHGPFPESRRVKIAEAGPDRRIFLACAASHNLKHRRDLHVGEEEARPSQNKLVGGTCAVGPTLAQPSVRMSSSGRSANGM